MGKTKPNRVAEWRICAVWLEGAQFTPVFPLLSDPKKYRPKYRRLAAEHRAAAEKAKSSAEPKSTKAAPLAEVAAFELLLPWADERAIR